MDKIEKIRQEIEQLRKLIDDHNYYLDNSEQALGYGLALDDIEKFLDTLSEEPDKSLEEAAEEYAQLDDEGIWKDGGKYKGFIAGAEWKEQQMLKEAKDGYVSAIIIHNDGDEVHYAVTYPNGERPHSITDKVKIIIL